MPGSAEAGGRDGGRYLLLCATKCLVDTKAETHTHYWSLIDACWCRSTAGTITQTAVSAIEYFW